MTAVSLLGMTMLCAVAYGETALWKRASVFARQWRAVKSSEAIPTISQRTAILTAIQKGHAAWGCQHEDPTGSWMNGLRYRRIHLADAVHVLLVEAGSGCARGGQGSNGAMWIVRLDRVGATILASERQKFGGFLWSIEPSSSKGYRDVIAGWHIGAGETGLSYFRFDGARYRRIGNAVLQSNQKGDPTLRFEL